MPKRKVDSEPLHPQIRIFEIEEDFDVAPTVVSVWCDGRTYDPDTETYRPQYSYSIVHSKWRYDGNDILGAANELPNLDKASQSLFAFLYASQESYARHKRGSFTDGNFELFPPHVNEWAEQNSEDMAQYSIASEFKTGLS